MVSSWRKLWTRNIQVSHSWCGIQPQFHQDFAQPALLTFRQTVGGLKCVLELLPETLTDEVIDDPRLIPALKQARNVALEAHPGLYYNFVADGVYPPVKHVSGAPSVITFRGEDDFGKIRVHATHYGYDGSTKTESMGTFVNAEYATHDGSYRRAKLEGQRVEELQQQAVDLSEHIGRLAQHIQDAEQELSEKMGRLNELDTLLSCDYPTMALDDVRPEPVVYFIREAVHTGLVKVGKTNNLHNRLPGLGETKGPVRFDYQIVHVIYTRHNDALERQLHRRFADKRRHGEWFALTPEDIAAIQGDYGTRWERT